jgi:hypothetical protein
MFNGKKVGGMDLDNGSSIELINLSGETVSSLTEKLRNALEEIERLKTHIQTLEQERD